MNEGTLQALRDRINARLQTSAISRDRASAAGREVVAQCRQSDVETLEWVLSEIDAVLATPEPGISLLRTPRGEGEGDALGMLQASVDEYLWEAQNNPQFDAEAAFAALSREIRAALRSEAQGEDELAALVVHMWQLNKQRGPMYTESRDFYVDFRRAYELAAARTNGGSDG